MDFIAIYLTKTLILPPAANLYAIAFALLTRRRWPRGSRALFGFGFWSLVLLSLPLIGAKLSRPLQNLSAFDVRAGAQNASAIVVLGGGRYPLAPEFSNRDTVHQRTLARLRYGAYLASHLELPVALIGGDASNSGLAPEGRLMYEVMRDAFNLAARWIETSSRNTAENAIFARQLLPSSEIILVTHAMHMKRARLMFELAGFKVIPAPTEFSVYPGGPPGIVDFLPSIGGLAESHAALHEYLGILWYRLRYRPDTFAALAAGYEVKDVAPASLD